MGSTRSLALLSALAAALVVAVVFDSAKAPDQQPTRRVLPGLSADSVRALSISQPGEPTVELERDGESGQPEEMAITAPLSVPASSTAVADLLATAELLSYLRRGARDPKADRERGLDAPRATLRFVLDSGRERALLVGADIDKVGAWVAISGEPTAYLVDSSQAGALVRDLSALRATRPFAPRSGRIERIEIAAGRARTVIVGPPWRAEISGGHARVDPASLSALIDTLESMRFTRFEGGEPASAPPDQLAVAVVDGLGRRELSELGPCPGSQRWVRAEVGAGCVDAAVIDELGTMAAPQALIDTRLVATELGPASALTLARGARSLSPALSGPQAELSREWLAAWGRVATGEVLQVGVAPAMRPVGHVTVTQDDIESRVDVFSDAGGRLLARREGEAVFLVLAPRAAELLDPSPFRFQPRDVWQLEPTRLREIRGHTTKFEHLVRGQLLEDWIAKRPQGGTVDQQAVGRLRQAIGYLRARRAVAPRPRAEHGLARPRRRIELTFDPAPGQSESVLHRIEVGADSDAGCYVQVDGEPTVLELDVGRCEALLGPWTR